MTVHSNSVLCKKESVWTLKNVLLQVRDIIQR